MDRDEEQEKSKGFKVEDRRRFSAEGELKPEHRGAEAPPPAGPASQSAAAEPPASTAAPATTSEGPAASPEEISFATFMVGLSTQALMHLGEIPDPQSQRPDVNLVAAQQLIDIVGMLKEKTRGNLDRDEESLVEGILFELRMKYVERSRHS
jgi:hypothetical protein